MHWNSGLLIFLWKFAFLVTCHFAQQEQEIASLRERLDLLEKSMDREVRQLKEELQALKSSSQQQSLDVQSRNLHTTWNVFFDAYRTSSWTTTDAYITFDGTYVNMGGGMNVQTGEFTAVVTGTYLFSFHGNTRPQSSCALEIRVNGSEAVYLWDNHLGSSNNRYSSVAQTILLQLQAGDRVQVYNRKGQLFDDYRRRTHFVGVLLYHW